MSKNIRYLMIVCPGHSGSTLLAMSLNAHKKIAFFGEFASMGKRLRQIAEGKRRSLCSFCGEGCRFIDKKELRLLKFCYAGRNRFIRWGKLLMLHPFYVRHFSRKTGTDIIGDSSKSIDWAIASRRFYSLFFDIKLIFLTRDGRGTINSYLRAGEGLEEAIYNWKREIKKILYFKDRLDASRYISIKYKDLVSFPSETLKKICRFIGIDFEESMLRYENFSHHIIGGNAGARIRVNIAQKQPLNHTRVDAGWYLKKDTSFFLDERWKDELDRERLSKIEHMIKEEQKELGYDVITT